MQVVVSSDLRIVGNGFGIYNQSTLFDVAAGAALELLDLTIGLPASVAVTFAPSPMMCPGGGVYTDGCTSAPTAKWPAAW